MPGTLEEKLSVYEQPYKEIVNALTQRADGYDILKDAGIIEFMSTSYIRGLTLDNTIILEDLNVDPGTLAEYLATLYTWNY